MSAALHASPLAAELTPGTTYVPDDHREPLVTVIGRTRCGVRVIVGDVTWLFRADSLLRVLERTGYRREVAS